MKIKVKFLLWLREKIGFEDIIVDVDEGVSLHDLVEIMRKKYSILDKYLNPGGNISIGVIVNGLSIPYNKWRKWALREGDIVELLPSVSGG